MRQHHLTTTTATALTHHCHSITLSLTSIESKQSHFTLLSLSTDSIFLSLWLLFLALWTSSNKIPSPSKSLFKWLVVIIIYFNISIKCVIYKINLHVAFSWYRRWVLKLFPSWITPYLVEYCGMPIILTQTLKLWSMDILLEFSKVKWILKLNFLHCHFSLSLSSKLGCYAYLHIHLYNTFTRRMIYNQRTIKTWVSQHRYCGRELVRKTELVVRVAVGQEVTSRARTGQAHSWCEARIE